MEVRVGVYTVKEVNEKAARFSCITASPLKRPRTIYCLCMDTSYLSLPGKIVGNKYQLLGEIDHGGFGLYLRLLNLAVRILMNDRGCFFD